jgi:excisionase family DNA binding protein
LLELVVHTTIYDMSASVDAAVMTSDEVAQSLGVSVRQVQRLVEAGELTGAGRVGRSLLIDTDSVNLLRANGSQRGRPWNARTVWIALDLLSGVGVGCDVQFATLASARTAENNDGGRSGPSKSTPR